MIKLNQIKKIKMAYIDYLYGIKNVLLQYKKCLFGRINFLKKLVLIIKYYYIV